MTEMLVAAYAMLVVFSVGLGLGVLIGMTMYGRNTRHKETE